MPMTAAGYRHLHLRGAYREAPWPGRARGAEGNRAHGLVAAAVDAWRLAPRGDSGAAGAVRPRRPPAPPFWSRRGRADEGRIRWRFVTGTRVTTRPLRFPEPDPSASMLRWPRRYRWVWRGSDMATRDSRLGTAMTVEEFRRIATEVEREIARVIVGQADVVREVLICLIAGGHALLEGVPGLGKTLLVRTFADTFELHFSRIQFTPDLMPADITGTTILAEGERGVREFRFQPGPIFANLVLADEINRATPKTQSALLEAMQEKTVTVANKTYQLNAPFFVLATQNPLEMEGTYPLPEAQLDRFFFQLLVPFPTASELGEILARTTSTAQPHARSVATGAQVERMGELARDVPIASHVRDVAVRLILATHPDHATAPPTVRHYVRYGASPRGAQALVLAGKVRALLDGRFNVAAEDIHALAKPALRHRVVRNFEGEAEAISTDDIITAALNSVGPRA